MMSNEQIIAACGSNWEYRGIDEASVREMVDELSAHLEDAEAAGRTGEDVVGRDVKAFAASWARARAPLPRRALRLVAMVCCMLGFLLLFSHLIRWTTQRTVTAEDLVYLAVLGTVIVAWEMRRGSLGLWKSWALGLVVGLPAALLTRWLTGGEALFTLELWVGPALLLPGLPYAVADMRAKRAGRARSGAVVVVD